MKCARCKSVLDLEQKEFCSVCGWDQQFRYAGEYRGEIDLEKVLELKLKKEEKSAEKEIILEKNIDHSEISSPDSVSKSDEKLIIVNEPKKKAKKPKITKEPKNKIKEPKIKIDSDDNKNKVTKNNNSIIFLVYKSISLFTTYFLVFRFYSKTLKGVITSNKKYINLATLFENYFVSMKSSSVDKVFFARSVLTVPLVIISTLIVVIIVFKTFFEIARRKKFFVFNLVIAISMIIISLLFSIINSQIVIKNYYQNSDGYFQVNILWLILFTILVLAEALSYKYILNRKK